MLFYAVTPVCVACTDGAIVGALWRWEAAGRKARRQLCVYIPQKIFLLETKPEIVVIIVDGGATIGWVWRAIRVENLTHNQVRIVAVWIWVDGDGLEQAV